MDLKELELIMSSKDYKNFLDLYKIEVEIYTLEWFEIEEMKYDILKQYGLEDIYGYKASDDDDDEHDDYY